jgi:YHS domain-containing protein
MNSFNEVTSNEVTSNEVTSNDIEVSKVVMHDVPELNHIPDTNPPGYDRVSGKIKLHPVILDDGELVIDPKDGDDRRYFKLDHTSRYIYLGKLISITKTKYVFKDQYNDKTYHLCQLFNGNKFDTIPLYYLDKGEIDHILKVASTPESNPTSGGKKTKSKKSRKHAKKSRSNAAKRTRRTRKQK